MCEMRGLLDNFDDIEIIENKTVKKYRK